MLCKDAKIEVKMPLAGILRLLRAAILSPYVLHVVRIAAQRVALSRRRWCSDRRQRQGHNCEGPESGGCGGYTSFRHSVYRWRHPTERAIYYRESIFRWYVKVSLLYSPFQFVFN